VGRSSGQSAVISAAQLSAILAKPPSATAAPAPNPHRRPSFHRLPAGSFIGGFRTPPSYPARSLTPGPASETLHVSGRLLHRASTAPQHRRKTSLSRDAPINGRAPSLAMASVAGNFVPPSGIREPSPRRRVSAVEDRCSSRTGVLTHLFCRRSWSRSEPRTHGHKVRTTKSRLVARRCLSVEHRRTWGSQPQTSLLGLGTIMAPEECDRLAVDKVDATS
jgi:hypothetical protein